MRRWPYLLPLGLFAALAAWFAVGLTRDPAALPSAMIDRPAPAFALPALVPGAPELTQATLAGQVAVVNFWASWCAPCRIEHPVLVELARSGVRVIGINYKDDPAAARRFLAQLGDPFAAIGRDVEGRTAIDFGVQAMPETLVIGPDGRIRLHHRGPLTRETVENGLKPALAALAR